MKYNTRTETRIFVEGLGDLVVRLEAGDKPFVEHVDLLEGDNRMLVSDGATYWFDYLPQLALDANVDEDQLKFVLAGLNILDKLRYEG